MGYQECLVFVTPQNKFNNMVEMCTELKAKGFYEDLTTVKPLNVVEFKKDIGSIKANTKALWVSSDRCFMYPNRLIDKSVMKNKHLKLEFIAAETIFNQNYKHLNNIDLDSDKSSENEYLYVCSPDEYVSINTAKHNSSFVDEDNDFSMSM